jgi:hypothetical protein
VSDLRADYRAWVKSHPNPTLGDGLTDALGAVGYAVESLPKPGHKMTQAAEQRLNEAMALLDAALATPAPTEDGPTVHVNDGSAHDNAMAWSAGHTDGWNEAQDALREMLVAIPATGLLEGANRYDTDDKYVLHVWRDGQSWDIEVPKVVGPAPTEDATHTGEERDTLVDMVHDALASTFGCDHPKYHPSECEVVADALIYGPRATMNHHAPPPVMAEPHGE